MLGSKHGLVSSRVRLFLLYTLNDMQNLMLPTAKNKHKLQTAVLAYPVHTALAAGLL